MEIRRSSMMRYLLLAFSVVALATACGDTVKQTVAPKAVFLPTAVVFDGVPPGTSTEQSLLVRNEGNGPLEIRSVRIEGPGVFTLENAPEGAFSLAKGEEAEFFFRYAPVDADDAAASGRFVLETNDPTKQAGMPDGILIDDGTIRVPLRVLEAQARVFVNPNPINFGRVAVGTTSTIDATLSNIGSVQLEVTEYFILGGAGVFQIAEESQLTGPITLAPGESRPIKMSYTPVSNDFIAASLVVMSSDPNASEGYLVEIIANGAEPCIEIAPSPSYDFGERTVNTTHSTTFTLRNCSDEQRGQPLNVSSLLLAEGSSPMFALVSAPSTPLTLAPGEDTAFQVTFHPEVDLRVEEAMLVATSNDPYFPVSEVTITGIGSNNSCPVARATCVVRGSDSPPLTDLFVRPLDYLDCTGASSTDDDGSIVDYIWSIQDAPADSTALPTPENARDTQFFVDLAGRYVITLTVVDDRGCASEPTPITVVSRPDEDIHIQLVWHTPSDPDETDTGFGVGSDIDIHLLHPNGCWESPIWDTHFRARSPNWGNPGSRDDDPSLDIDDTDGAGPENINLNNPENGVTYLVAAHYYDDHGFGPSTATIRIYIYGELVFEQSKLMPRTDFWWVAAAVTWPSALVTGVDQEYDSTPPCAR